MTVSEAGTNQQSMSSFKVFENPETVAREAAAYLFQQINKCVDLKGECHVVLPGGTTPARCLELLTAMPLSWKHIHWYPGDERCYPPGHAERNDSMILDKLFRGKKDNMVNFHPIPAELGPEQGAERYAQLINKVGDFDIVVLGMGEDGHTASLFPENAALDDSRRVVPVHNAPKPPDERITLGLTVLRSAGECVIIATGSNKREIITKIREGVVLPVCLVGPDVWFVDQAAIK